MRNILSLVAVIFVLSSCSKTIIQLHKVSPCGNISTKDSTLVFEDENCMIVYNFWIRGGDPGFYFINKTNQNIYLNLSECFFVKNGFAYDYFLKRTFSRKVDGGRDAVAITIPAKEFPSQDKKIGDVTFLESSESVSRTVGIHEKEIIVIPGNSTKRVCEYKISNYSYKSHDFVKAPKKKSPQTIAFNEQDSPIKFENRICYMIDGKTVSVANKFYVSKIANYDKFDLIEVAEKKNDAGTVILREERLKKTPPDEYYFIINY